MALPTPVSRADMYLSYLNYTKGLTLDDLPTPVSRSDMYLYNLCVNRGIGGGSGGSNVTLNGEPQTNFNFIGDENSTISALQIGEKTYSFNGGSSSGDGDTTDNVVDRAGRTQEQINRTFYKRMCKEIPSPSGEPITVENGEEGYVLSAEIKGQTVKNYIHGSKINCTTPAYKFIPISENINDFTQLEPGKTYTLSYNVLKTLNKILRNTPVITYDDETKVYQGFDNFNNVTGVKSWTFTIPIGKKIKALDWWVSGQDSTTSDIGDIEVDIFSLVEGSTQFFEKLPFGLSSTEAIISNNGQSYPIYASEEDKANKKVISLGGVGGVQDNSEIKDDGGVVYTQNTKEIVLDNNINCTLTDSYSSENHLFFNITVQDIKIISDYRVQGIICDRFKWEEFASFASKDYEFICGNNVNAKVGIKIAKAKLESPTVEGFKKWLQNNPVIVQYQLATPIVTHIDKSITPTILTNQTNILEVGGAVKPSSFKVTVPVDRIAELTARLEAVEAKTNTQPVNTAFVDETYAKSVNKIEEVIK